MHVGDARYALRGSDVSSIESHQHLYRLPLWPPTVAGISRREGQNVLVLDLAACLGADLTAPEGEPSLLRLEGGEQPRAFEVRCHVEHLEVEEIDTLPLPRSMRSAGIRQCVHCGKDLIPLIDASNLWNQVDSHGTVPSPSALSGSFTSVFGELFLREEIDVVEVTFRGKRYALPAAEVRGSFALRPYVCIPNVPMPAVGVAEHDGILLPVVDIAGALGLRSHVTPESQMIVVENGDLRVLLLVDTVAPSRTIPPAQQRRIPPPIALPHAPTYGCYVDDAGVGAILNVAAIVTHFAEIEARGPISADPGPLRASPRAVEQSPDSAGSESLSEERLPPPAAARPVAIVGHAFADDAPTAEGMSLVEPGNGATPIAPTSCEVAQAAEAHSAAAGSEAASASAAALPLAEAPAGELAPTPGASLAEPERGEDSIPQASGDAKPATVEARAAAGSEAASASAAALPLAEAPAGELAPTPGASLAEPERGEDSIPQASGEAKPAAVEARAAAGSEAASASAAALPLAEAPAGELAPTPGASLAEPESGQILVAPLSSKVDSGAEARSAAQSPRAHESASAAALGPSVTSAPGADMWAGRPAGATAEGQQDRPESGPAAPNTARTNTGITSAAAATAARAPEPATAAAESARPAARHTTRPAPTARRTSTPTSRVSRIRVASVAALLALLVVLALLATGHLGGALLRIFDFGEGPSNGAPLGVTEETLRSHSLLTQADTPPPSQSEVAPPEPTRSLPSPFGLPLDLSRSGPEPQELAPFPSELVPPERSPSELVPPERSLSELEPSERIPSELEPPERIPSELEPPERIPSELEPLERSPSELVPPERSPSELVPPERSLSELEPSERIPSELEPLERSLSEPEPLERIPSELEPLERSLSEPEPLERIPSEPEPLERIPSEPEPPEPSLSEPEPPERIPSEPAPPAQARVSALPARRAEPTFPRPASVPGAGGPSRLPRTPGAGHGGDAIEHVVVTGDTLWDLCERYVGDPFDYPRVARDNAIPNPHLIEPGQVIRFRKRSRAGYPR